MADITTRSGKGSPLTNNEVDANFTNLNNDKLETSGGSVTGNVSFSDNAKAIFGAGSDLQIFSEGSGGNSFIQESGSGSLYINATNLYLRKGEATFENFIACTANGDVKLYYDNSAKLATTATGIDVTGTVTADGLTVDGTATISSNSSATIPTLTIEDTDSGIVIGQTLGRIDFKQNDVDNAGVSARIQFDSDFNNGISGLQLWTGSPTSLTKAFEVDNNGDISFYEDTGTTPKFFWDASAESLGIGTTSPVSLLHLNSATSNANLILQSADASNAGVFFGDQTDVSRGSISYENPNDALTFTTNNLVEAMRIDSSGRLIIGASSTVSVANSNAYIQQHGNKSTVNLALAAFNNNAGGPILALGSSRSTTVGTVGTVVVNGDTLGEIRFAGDDGTDMNTTGASISAQVDGTPGSNDMPGRLVFSTTADGSASASERMRITSSGQIGIGTTSPAKNLVVSSSTSATLRLNSSSTGVTTSDILGAIEFYSNDTSANGTGIAASIDSTPGDSFGQGGELRFSTRSTAITNAVERMRIDSSGNVGIGTSSPTTGLECINSNGQITGRSSKAANTNASLRLMGGAYTGNTATAILLDGVSGSNRLYLGGGTSLGEPSTFIAFMTGTAGSTGAGTERMRIDSSGNLLVGTTSAVIANSSSNVGTAIGAGLVESARAGVVAQLNRHTSDGVILDFQKDGTSVGSIGSFAGVVPYFSAPQAGGVRFTYANSTNAVLVPCTTTGADADASHLIGSASSRWKDLYLSGGVYLGGTGAANLLDDYEEGTFTPSLEGASTAGTYELASVSGVYTKIGRQITINVSMTLDSVITGGGSGYARIRGLPVNYDSSENPGAYGVVFFSGVNYDASASYITVARSSSADTNTLLFNEIIPNAAVQLVDISDFTAGDVIRFSFTYNAV